MELKAFSYLILRFIIILGGVSLMLPLDVRIWGCSSLSYGELLECCANKDLYHSIVTIFMAGDLVTHTGQRLGMHSFSQGILYIINHINSSYNVHTLSSLYKYTSISNHL